MTDTEFAETEGRLAAAIYSMENLREVCHEWLEGMLDEMKDKGKLACTAQVLMTPEGSTSEIGMMISLTFMPMTQGMPVIEPLMPTGKGGMVH